MTTLVRCVSCARVGMWGLLFVAAGCGPNGTAHDPVDATWLGADAAQPDAAPGVDSEAPQADAAPGPDAGPPVDPCEPILGVSYDSMVTVGPVTDRPPDQHADLNLKLRGWEITGGFLGLIDIPGPTDALAPKLDTLFAPDRLPAFSTNYAVYNWDWGSNSRAGLITDWEVTLAGFGTTVGEILELPGSGYDIGGGHQARVLFADHDSITLKYTGEDNVVQGYTVHVVGLCVEPALKARYDADHAAGRAQLPALYGGQPFGRARGAEIQVAIRDTGAFMDPRSEKDWW
ncbi:MAG: hypothetical protein ABI333_21665 [bacterium]